MSYKAQQVSLQEDTVHKMKTFRMRVSRPPFKIMFSHMASFLWFFAVEAALSRKKSFAAGHMTHGMIAYNVSKPEICFFLSHLFLSNLSPIPLVVWAVPEWVHGRALMMTGRVG